MGVSPSRYYNIVLNRAVCKRAALFSTLKSVDVKTIDGHSIPKESMIPVNKIALMLVIVMSLFLFSSCDKIGHRNESGGIIIGEGQKADERMEQIISAIKANDKEALKSLFSKKALDEIDDLDGEVDSLFNFIQGDITSWERDGWASDESIEYGKKSLMIRFAINVNTDKDKYRFFIIDYSTDTINPDNEGVYMLEVRLAETHNSGSWQDRMRPGISIVE